MLTFKQFLNEAYQDLSQITFNDRYDKDFAYYALNERPLKWDEKERKECSKLYGNINVGVVYFGGKIDNQKLYEQIIKLKPENTFHMNLQSATPDKSTAQSFMDYTKSYSELIMLQQLVQNLERGSSGKFGTYLLTLKPTPEQVICSTFGPTLKQLSHGAETECILFGDIKVLDIKIREVLSPETYQHIILNDFPDILSSSFVSSWLSKKIGNIPTEFAKQLLIKIKTLDEVYTFFHNSLGESPYVLNSLSFQDLIDNKLIKSVFDHHLSISAGNLSIDLPKFQPIYIPINSNLDKNLKKIYKNTLVISTQKKLNDISSNPFKVKLTDSDSTTPNYLIVDDDAREIIHSLIYLKNYGKNIHHPIIDILNRINLELKKRMRQLILTKKLSDYNSEQQLESLKHLFNSSHELDSFKDILTPISDYYKKGISYFYNSFAKGKITNRNTFKSYQIILASILNQMST